MILSKLRVNISRSVQSVRWKAKCCPPPKPFVVTIIGADTLEGQYTALLLKQNNYIDEVRLYSGLIGVCGVALDLSHINTNSNVKAYTGQKLLKDAIVDAHIILICGGLPTKSSQDESTIFFNNADYVRNVALYISEFNPEGIVCTSTQPISAMVPLISEEMKRCTLYDPKKIMGITTLSVMRANALTAKYMNKNPSEVAVPVIGGMWKQSGVPVFSQMMPTTPIEKKMATFLQDKLFSMEDEVLDLKYLENAGDYAGTSAIANARFITSVSKGLKGIQNVIECAFVRQMGSIQTYLPYMTSVVKLGINGVESCHMPKLNELECETLQNAYPLIKKSIDMGISYVNGDLPKECRVKPRVSGYCDVFTKVPITKIGDIELDREEITKGQEEICVEVITS